MGLISRTLLPWGKLPLQSEQTPELVNNTPKRCLSWQTNQPKATTSSTSFIGLGWHRTPFFCSSYPRLSSTQWCVQYPQSHPTRNVHISQSEACSPCLIPPFLCHPWYFPEVSLLPPPPEWPRFPPVAPWYTAYPHLLTVSSQEWQSSNNLLTSLYMAYIVRHHKVKFRGNRENWKMSLLGLAHGSLPYR